jgi:hypothetical protein
MAEATSELVPRLGGLHVDGVEFSFVQHSMEAAAELAQKSSPLKADVSPQDKVHALRRAQQQLSVFGDARMLWVDDHPENNVNERRMFR